MTSQLPPHSPPADFEGSQPSALNSQLAFPSLPAETPRAYSAFMAFFQLGHGRSLAAVADHLGENPDTIKQWSRRHGWTGRIQAYNSGILHQQAQDQADRQRKKAADWAQRLESFREQEWEAAQKLLAAARCFLESFGDEDVQKMTLGQVSRALRISSDIGRLALAGAELPMSADPVMSPIQQQLMDAVRRVYGEAAETKSITAEPDPDPPKPDPTQSNCFHHHSSPPAAERRADLDPAWTNELQPVVSPALDITHPVPEIPEPKPAVAVSAIVNQNVPSAPQGQPSKSEPPLPSSNAAIAAHPTAPKPMSLSPESPKPLPEAEPPAPFRGIRPLGWKRRPVTM